jgi:HKD family nuclease
MIKLLSNSSERDDFLRGEMLLHAKETNVYIAVAFFTYTTFIRTLIENGCNIYLIVRLGGATSEEALRQVLEYGDRIQVRYFTDSHYHPKLYVYGESIAFVGSSNLTDAGLNSNNELNIAIDSEESIFSEINDVFQS